VKKFDDGGKFDGAPGIGLAAGSVTMTEQKQSGAQAFASAAEKITGNFGNWLISRGTLARKFLFHLDEVFANQFKYFLGSE
jgi:hypothetical protein